MFRVSLACGFLNKQVQRITPNVHHTVTLAEHHSCYTAKFPSYGEPSKNGQ